MNKLFKMTQIEIHCSHVPKKGGSHRETVYPFIGQAGRSLARLLAQLAASL